MISGLSSVIFSIMFMNSNFYISGYIFSMLNEHILISSVISMSCKSVIR
jgi:hypothetical protein